MRRCGVLQQVLYLAFRTAIEASFQGVEVDTGVKGIVRMFLRVLLYVCDQPEERAILCLRAGTSGKPCSSCRVSAEDSVLPVALNAAEREVVPTLERHLEAASHYHARRERQRRLKLERYDSLNSAVPALAAMAGLGTTPHLLYKMVGFDVLHVRLSGSCLSTRVSKPLSILNGVATVATVYCARREMMVLTLSCAALCALFVLLIIVSGADIGPWSHSDARPPPDAHLSVHVQRGIVPLWQPRSHHPCCQPAVVLSRTPLQGSLSRAWVRGCSFFTLSVQR